MSNVFIDGGDQLGHAGKHPAAQTFGGDVVEEPLDHIQPGGRGWREMHSEARMPGQPLLHGGMLVCGVVVGDQVQRLGLGRFAVDLFQEPQPLGVGVALLALAHDLAIQDVERGKQHGRAIALSVVRQGGGAPLLQRQTRLRAIQRLNLALLVAAQHQRMVRGRHVQAHDVFKLLHELRITRDLETAHAVGLQAIGVPDAQHCGIAHAHVAGQGPRAPLGCRGRQRLGRAPHDFGGIHLGRTLATRQVVLDGYQTALRIALSPAPDLHTADVDLGRNRLVIQARRRQQHDTRPSGQSHARGVRARQAHQLLFFRRTQFDHRGYAHRWTPAGLCRRSQRVTVLVPLFVKQYTSSFVQDNHSCSKKGVLRGLHYQLPTQLQGNLVRVIQSAADDIAVDIREGLPTFGQCVGMELNIQNRHMLWMPEGFARGFVALEDDTHLLYKTTDYYAKDCEAAIRWNDSELEINWPDIGQLSHNEKDTSALMFKAAPKHPVAYPT